MKLKVLIISIALMLSFSLGAFAQSKVVNIMFNGKMVNNQAKIIDGITYVPLRTIGEMFGAYVGWDGATSTVKITSGTGNVQEISKPVPSNPSQPTKEQINNAPEKVDLGETVTKNGISITIKKVEYDFDNEWGNFKVYIDLKNNSEKSLMGMGSLRFKLNDSKYEDEVNRIGYTHYFDNNGYIYSGESRSGYYEYHFERDIKIKEIDYFLQNGSSIDSRYPTVTWEIE